MLLIAGFPALILFGLFWISLLRVDREFKNASTRLIEVIIGVCVVGIVFSLFNSSIKDYGEKHVLIILMTYILSRLLGYCRYERF
jgi:hypothetical protein